MWIFEILDGKSMHGIGQALGIPFKVSSAAGFFVNCVHIVCPYELICCMPHECTLQVEVLDEES